jgi:hypothetical protein
MMSSRKETSMELPRLLEETRADAVADAIQGLGRATLPHYTASRTEQNRERLAKLYDLTAACVSTRTLLPMIEYAKGVARERYKDGFDLEEVHTAFNVLEEVIWRRITARLEPPQYPEAFGLISTVLGAGKQALAMEYVALVSQSHDVHSLDLTALFKGTT